MTIRTMESGLLMILEAIRILEPNRAPGESRYTPLTNLDSWANGEALISIVSVAAGIELLLKQLLIDLDLRLLFADEQIPDDVKLERGDFKTVSFGKCIHRVQKLFSQKFTKTEESVLFQLADKRNKAVHAGFADRPSLEVFTARALVFVLHTYFDRFYDSHKLSSAEHHIYSRINMTANEFQAYNNELEVLYGDELRENQRKEFLWQCRNCDHQFLKIRGERGVCYRCKDKDYDIGECAFETSNQDKLSFEGRLLKPQEVQTGTCRSAPCNLLEMTDFDRGTSLYCCTNCGETFKDLSAHQSRSS